MERLDILERDMTEVKSEIRDLKSEFRELRKNLNARFQWMVGLLFASWITIILTILFKV